MMWSFRKREAPDDVAVLVKSLTRYRPEPYTNNDKIQDFRAVFLGESTKEQGQRVLNEILLMARVYWPAVPSDPNRVMFSEGERSLALRILNTAMADIKRTKE